jgi:tRNA dimethylallyltransferase
MSVHKVLTLVGPTASGKTGVSYQIASIIKKKSSAEPVIISADSRQVYKHIPIASSYPPENYLKEFKHYFIGELELDDEFNAGEYGKKAREIILNALSSGKIPVIVGGSGLYISSLIYGLFDYEEAVEDNSFKERQKAVRRELEERLKKEGIEKLLKELKRVDETSAGKMSNVNSRRIIRALEVYYTTGIPISKLQAKKTDVGFEAVQFGLNRDRNTLYDRINKRVDRMLANGLVEEIKSLKARSYNYIDYNSLNTVGVKEVFDYLSGLIDYERMTELMKQNTRRFAKRQLTWFRKDKNIKWIDVNEYDELGKIAERIIRVMSFPRKRESD